MIARMKSHPQDSRGFCGGVWWCLTCNAPAQLEDPGEPYPRCAACEQRKCEWRAHQEVPSAECRVSRAEPDQAPIEAQPMLNVRRLPRAERPSLTQMTYQGYWLCQGCEQPTKKGADDCCVLCGSSQVEFQEPTLS